MATLESCPETPELLREVTWSKEKEEREWSESEARLN